MDDDALLDLWRREHQRPIEGWDFSELDGRYVEQQPPWSWNDLARKVLRDVRSALDMGTGGGEQLLELADVLPADTIATEGWAPNIPVARRSLAQQGIEVAAYDAEQDAAMPFPDNRFEVVLNRHEAYRASEVLRVLRPGGTFLTQQVDGRDFEETQAIFGGRSAYAHITRDHLRAEAVDTGFNVEEAEEWQGTATFADVAALVRYFAMVPWEVPDDFGVDRYAEQLLALHHSGRALSFTQRRFYLRCLAP